MQYSYFYIYIRKRKQPNRNMSTGYRGAIHRRRNKNGQ